MSLRWVFTIILGAAVLANAGCATVYYYGQAVFGHLRVMASSRDIERLVETEAVPDDVARRLKRIQEIRRFAIDSLHLPDNGSYTRYAELGREHVVWNVFAAPEFSTRPLTWCYPVVGCVAYRGYYSQSAAQRFADQLRREGRDVFVAGVDAYSTLGRLRDPVLSSFIDYPETRTAALLFHEMAHQLVYVADDTLFNESFATAVADAGVERWLAAHGQSALMARYRRRQTFVDAVTELMVDYRARFDALYARALGDDVRRARKVALADALYRDYVALAEKHGIEKARLSLKRADMNNALVTSFDIYHRYSPAFEAMLESRSGDLAAFYDDVRTLAKRPVRMRHAALEALTIARETSP